MIHLCTYFTRTGRPCPGYPSGYVPDEMHRQDYTNDIDY